MVDLTSATSLQGSDIDIEVDSVVVVLNGSSTVIWTDVEAESGIIHVIDAVLLPSEGDQP